MPFPPSQDGLGSVKAVAPTRSQPKATAKPQGPVWHPPLPVWLFLLLHVLSFGIYTAFWIGHVAGDIRRHLDPQARAWRYVLGYLVAFVQPFVVVKLGRHFAAFNARQERTVGPPIWIMVILAALNIPLYFVAAGLGYRERALRDFLVLAAVLAVVSLPWLLLQRQFNVLKAGLEDVAWTAPPRRVTVSQYFLLSFGLLLWGLTIFGLLIERYDFGPAPAGVALEPAAVVRGDSGLYALSVPGPGWRRAPKGHITADADLELIGPGPGTRLVVYVSPDEDQSVDDFVDYRRRSLRAEVDSLEAEEVRRLLDCSMVPVSFARYRSHSALFGEFEIYWVATLRSDKAMIEVIGWSDPRGPGPAALESLVKSVVPLAPAPQRNSSANSASTSR